MDNHIADVIRRSGKTQAAFAVLLGLSRQSFSDRMVGRTRWTVSEAMALARSLGMSVDALVGADDLTCDLVPAETVSL